MSTLTEADLFHMDPDIGFENYHYLYSQLNHIPQVNFYTRKTVHRLVAPFLDHPEVLQTNESYFLFIPSVTMGASTYGLAISTHKILIMNQTMKAPEGFALKELSSSDLTLDGEKGMLGLKNLSCPFPKLQPFLGHIHATVITFVEWVQRRQAFIQRQNEKMPRWWFDTRNERTIRRFGPFMNKQEMDEMVARLGFSFEEIKTLSEFEA